MNEFNRLKELFSEFPGIGPRQAERFVYFILRKNNFYVDSLANSISKLKHNIRQCEESFQFFYSEDSSEKLAPLARNTHRDDNILLIVEKDTDLETIERSGEYSGKYFVLGGTIPLMEKEPTQKVRINQLKFLIEKKAGNGLQEVIFALSANPDGEYTTKIVKEYLSDLESTHGFVISELGRGLSTGTELEYSDKETIKNALRYRHS